MRQRALPLSMLMGTLLCMRGTSQQTLVDKVFTALSSDAQPARGVSDRAFAKARSHLHVPAVTALYDDLMARAETAGLLPRWQGLRVVAADASVLMPAIRRCPRTRGLAHADQRLFALYLPGAELTLHAEVYLDYFFDLWARQWRRRGCRCHMIVVRYANDIVVGFEHEDDTGHFWDAMRTRLYAFGLELHGEKTQLLEFGRYPAERRRSLGLGKPPTFNFLGFTFICGRNRRGGGANSNARAGQTGCGPRSRK